MKYTFLCLSLLAYLSNLWGMQEIPLQPMHTAQEVIEKFEKKIIIYDADTEYLAPKLDFIYTSAFLNGYYGYVSPRSYNFNFQPNVKATHSIKKLINIFTWPGWEAEQESLLTNWSVYEGNLKMRLATQKEIDAFCQIWCPDNYDFDYEDGSDLSDIAKNYCCPANICCANQSAQS